MKFLPNVFKSLEAQATAEARAKEAYILRDTDDECEMYEASGDNELVNEFARDGLFTDFDTWDPKQFYTWWESFQK